jgi:hypothetical protein
MQSVIPAPLKLQGPWLKKRRWASGRIRDQSGSFIFFSVLFALIWNTVAVLATISVWRDHAQGAVLFVVPLLLDALGLVIAAWAIRQIRVRMKFGRSVLELEVIPGVIGGWLAGTVRAPVVLEGNKGLRLHLECVNQTHVRTLDNKTSQREITLMSANQVLAHLPYEGNRACIPVAFAIPAGARESGRDGFGGRIVWRLRARATQAGADYDATFIVPVFEAPGASREIPKAETLAATLRTSHQPLTSEEE